MPPHDVMFSYGMNNLTWWMNGTISESQCFSVETFSCKTSNVMKFELFLDHRTCPITVNSLLRAGFVGGIQMDNCLEITRGMFDMHTYIAVFVLLDIMRLFCFISICRANANLVDCNYCRRIDGKFCVPLGALYPFRVLFVIHYKC